METDGTRSASPDRASGDSIRRSVRGRKADTRAQAEAMSLPLLQDGRIAPARLVPVGPWILDDEECIRSIRDWRERNMTMFLPSSNRRVKERFNTWKIWPSAMSSASCS